MSEPKWRIISKLRGDSQERNVSTTVTNEAMLAEVTALVNDDYEYFHITYERE